MNLEHLFEAPQNERRMRNAARRIAKEIIGTERDLEHAVIRHENRNGKVIFVPVAYTTTSYPDLVIGVIPAANPAIFQLKRPENASTFPENIAYAIVFDIRPDIHMPETPNFENMLEIARHSLPNYHYLQGALQLHLDTFIHEFTHYWDMTNAGAQLNTTGYRTDKKAYFNTSLERNAYYQEVMASLDQNPRLFKSPFEGFIKRVFGMFNKEFVRNLEEANRRRIISRLYAVWSAKQVSADSSPSSRRDTR